MLKQYPKFKRLEVEKVFKKLPKTEQKLINDYLFYRKSRGLSDGSASDLRRYIIQVRKIIDCNFKSFNKLENLSRLSVLINNSYLSNEVKKNLRINLSNLFKYLFPDWRSKFMELDCFSNKSKKGEQSENGVISEADLPTDKEIEKMLQSEHSTFYKTFLLYHSTGLRTIETRKTEIKNINFDVDGSSRIEIFMTKTGKKKFVFADKQTTDYIKKLIEELKNTGRLGKYLFPSPKDISNPISKMQLINGLRSYQLRRPVDPLNLIGFATKKPQHFTNWL